MVADGWHDQITARVGPQGAPWSSFPTIAQLPFTARPTPFEDAHDGQGSSQHAPAVPLLPFALTPDAKAKLEALAAELGDHTAMRQLFYNHWVGEWPSHDRCKDQLPSNYRPRAIDNTGRKDADSKKRGADSTWDTSDDHSVKRSRASTRS